MSRDTLPFRQIHLDFHTSEHIKGIGSAFDPEEFADTLKKAHINSVTLFAKCHHGWCYYPTEVGTPHPHLDRPDLLGDMIEACRKVNIATPVYITAQWDELTARTRPEWRVIPADGSMRQFEAKWHPVSLTNTELVDHIAALSQEVVNQYDPEGIFTDILLYWQDVSAASIERMQSRGLNPESKIDRLKNDREVILDYYERITTAIHEINPKTRVFHNSGHIFKNERERYQHFTHLELESLPTGGWGYDHFPISARYAATLDKDYMGQTGKFHTWWGDFGGYKRPEALEYECCMMAALGARCEVGDQLHPSGKIDADTYASIAPAYARIEKLEPFLIGARPVSEIAVYSAEGHYSRNGKISDDPHDAGCCRMLLESQIMFDVIDEESDFTQYKLIILPDIIRFEPGPRRDKFQSYLDQGGKLILSYQSGLNSDGAAFVFPFPAELNGKSEYEKEYIRVSKEIDQRMPDSPFVIYEQGMSVTAKGAEVLGSLYEPYFNRSWDHFCSHQHTPYQEKPSETKHSILKSENIVYFAHPIFLDYRNSGQPLVKYAFTSILKQLLGELQVSACMPSAGRLSLMEQKRENRTILHLLFAQPQTRGGTLNSAHGLTSLQIIEDVTPIYEVAASLHLEEEPKRVYSAYSGENIEFSYQEGKAAIFVPKLYIHEAIVIE